MPIIHVQCLQTNCFATRFCVAVFCLLIQFAIADNAVAQSQTTTPAATSAAIQSQSQARFVTEIMSPFQLKKAEQLTGFAVEIVDEIITRTQIKGEIEVYPWARAYTIALNEPNVFIFTLVKTKERLEKFVWIDEYYVATDSFYALSSRADIVINSVADAKKYITCIPRNDVGEQRLMKLGFNDNHLKKVAVQSQCLGMLHRARVDLNLFNELGIRSLSSKFNIDRNKFKRVFVVSKAVMGIAASKNTSPAMIAAVRKALAQIKSESQYEKNIIKWFHTQ